MKRRDFLRAAGLVTAATALPSWLTDAAWEPPKGPEFTVGLIGNSPPLNKRSLITLSAVDKALREHYIPEIKRQLGQVLATDMVPWDGESDLVFPVVEGTITHVVAKQGGETFTTQLSNPTVSLGHDITIHVPEGSGRPDTWR